MRKTKILAVILSSLMLLMTFASTAFALGNDDLNALGQYFGGGNTTSKADPDEPSSKGYAQVNSGSGLTDLVRGILGSAANGLSNSQLTEILKNFNISQLLGGDTDVLNEIMDYIASFAGGNTGDTTKPTKAPTTEAPATEPPSTESPTIQIPSYTYVYVPQTQAPPTYVYIPQTEPVTVPIATTAVEEPTTVVEYVPPEQIITDVLTTGVYPAYSIEDEAPESSNTLKIVAGLVIVVVSLVAVVGVSIALKKSRI